MQNASRTHYLTIGSGQFNGFSLQTDLPNEETHTVQFNLTPPIFPSDPAGAIFLNVEAVITWSAGGNSVTRRVTVSDGAAVQGICKAVNVKIYDASRIIAPYSSTIKPYPVSVQVAKGARGANSNPPFLYDVNTLVDTIPAAPGGGVPSISEIPILQDIGANSIYVQCFSSGQVTPVMSVVANQGFSNGSTTFFVNGWDVNSDVTYVPLIPSANILRVSNYNAFPVGISIYYGIEG